MTHNIISYYALTDDFRQLIAAKIQEPGEFAHIGRLRNLGLLSMLKRLRGLKADSITVAIENDNARPLAAPLLLLAAVTGSRRISVLWPNGTVEKVSRLKIAGLISTVISAQVSSRWASKMAARELKKLEDATHTHASSVAGNGDAVLYLDANLSFGLSAGGSVGHTRGVIDGFIKRGFEVDYASCKPLPTDLPKARWLQVPAGNLFSFPPELNHYPYNRDFERRVAQRISGRSYSFIYQRMSVHNFSGAHFAKALRIPLVLEFNGSEAWAAANWHEKLKLHDLAVQAELVSLRNADLVITISKVLGDEVVKAGVPTERIVVYPNCIDPGLFDPSRFDSADGLALRKRWNIPADALVATFVGTFGTWHGVDFLAKAVRRLIDNERDWLERKKLHFLFVGDGLRMAEVKEAVGDTKYSPFVTLTGLVPQSDAPRYLHASDIFLSPHVPNPDGTAFFGSPTKLFEYMAMERPIIASDLDQIGKVLKGTYLSGSTQASEKPLAELFPPGDETRFLVALRHVAENPEEASEMATRARAAALACYTWDHHVGAIMDRMRQLEML